LRERGGDAEHAQGEEDRKTEAARCHRMHS
jgi:hypothetical protein